MTAKLSLVTAVTSLVTLAGIAPASAAGAYYEGIDINAKPKSSSAATGTEGSGARGIRHSTATYGFPAGAEPRAATVTGDEGDYYQGINRR